MVRKTSVLVDALLILATGLLAAGCGGTAAPSAAGTGGTSAASPGAGSPAAGSPAAGGGTAGGTTGAASGAAACSGGLTGTEPGVIMVVCNGAAKVHVRVGAISKDFVGGQCHVVGNRWSMTDGVITEKGTYQGRPVDVVSVNNQASGRGTIQVSLGGKSYFVDNASFDLSDGKQAARLRGKTTPESDSPGTTVTVDVAC
jgi:hypothetical protein